MRLQRYLSGERISITPSNLLGAGGEARVYVVPPDARMVAKVYHRPTQAQLGKLRVMIANPPEDPTKEQSHISIAWPIDLLSMAYGDHGFAGYLMPRVPGIRPIFQVYNPATRRQCCPLFNYQYLHRAARNLASCVRAVHQRDYVIGDINESNILVSDTALVTLVDTDSFQVKDPSTGIVYRCPVGKPEYTPPELQGRRFSNLDRTPEHDRFGLAVLLFQLLMEGAHPFAGLFQGLGDPPPYEERIGSGHFAYGSRRVPYRPMPIAPSLDLLDPTLRQLFLRCFEDGHSVPTVRPDAQTWQSALAEAEKALVPCAVNPRHFYGRHLPSCPWCERTALLGGRDPFPSEPIRDPRPPRRVSASSVLAAASSSAASRSHAGTSGTGAPSPYYPSTAANWPANGPVSASLNGGIPSALPPTPPLLVITMPRNGWAWGALFWALLAVLALPLGLPGLNGLMAALGLTFGAAGWQVGKKLRGGSRWVSAASAVCSVGSLALRPLTGPPQADLHVLHTGVGGVRSLCFSPDGRTLAVGTSRLEDSSLTGGEVILWDTPSERRLSTPYHAIGDVASVAFSPDSKSIAAADDTPFGTGEVVLLSISSDNAYQTLTKEKRYMGQLAYSQDGALLACAGSKRMVNLWDTKSMEPLPPLEPGSDPDTISFAPHSPLLAVGTASAAASVVPGTVTVWNALNGRMLWSQAAHGNGVQCVRFSPDGSTVASGGYDGALCFWSAATGRLLRRQTAHSYGISALAYSPDGARIASAEELQTGQGTIYEVVLRDGRSGEPLQALKGHTDEIQTLAFSPDGKRLASGSRDGTIRLWYLNSARR